VTQSAAPTPRRTTALLAPATFFEGYDILLLGLALPLIREEFGLSLAAAGVVGSIVFSGQFGSLILLLLADRIGRRPVLTVTIAGYTVATALTASSQGIAAFTVYQFVARVFLGAEKPLANILIVESHPEQRRGRSLGVLSSMTALGQAAAGLGFLLVVGTGASWRWLYVAGVLPLVLVARARRDLPETADPAHRTVVLWGGLAGVRRRWLAGASALNFLFAVFPTAVTFWASSLLRDEWGWNLKAINPVFFVLWALGLSGFFVAGRMMDFRGRRPTAIAFFAVAAVAGVLTFSIESDFVRGVGLALVIFGLTGATPCMSAYATEPFPAHLRGHVGAVVRVADIAGSAAAPSFVGLLAGTIGGIGPGLAVAGLSYALGAQVVMLLLPETKGAEPPRGD
jgi:putative MFS transporter